jgi:MYXO-CTERM domain-containing protein
MKKCFFVAGLSAFVVTAASSAEITGVKYQGRYVDAVDGFGAPDFSGYVIDLWLESNDATDTVLNTFNVNIGNNVNADSYYQSFTGGTWLPNNLGPPFETEALMHADSFVSMGGRDVNLNPSYMNGVIVQMNANGTGLDPNFGGTTAPAPGADAGWYNSNPEVYIGSPVDGVVFIGRFALNGVSDFDIFGEVSVTWNNGIGSPGHQVENLEIMEVPAPGALALLGLAGLATRRRNRS